jgi:hypothetical protein
MQLKARRVHKQAILIYLAVGFAISWENFNFLCAARVDAMGDIFMVQERARLA